MKLLPLVLLLAISTASAWIDDGHGGRLYNLTDQMTVEDLRYQVRPGIEQLRVNDSAINESIKNIDARTAANDSAINGSIAATKNELKNTDASLQTQINGAYKEIGKLNQSVKALEEKPDGGVIVSGSTNVQLNVRQGSDSDQPVSVDNASEVSGNIEQGEAVSDTPMHIGDKDNDVAGMHIGNQDGASEQMSNSTPLTYVVYGAAGNATPSLGSKSDDSVKTYTEVFVGENLSWDDINYLLTPVSLSTNCTMVYHGTVGGAALAGWKKYEAWADKALRAKELGYKL